MTWKKWRRNRKRERAQELGVEPLDLRFDPIRLTWWYFGWLAQILPETTLYQFLRMLEVPAIIVALVAFWIDYADRPIDRATRNAQLLAQVAELATIDHANASGGIKAILEFLADEDVSMRGIALEGTKLSGVDLKGAHLRSANLTGANLFKSDLSGADLRRADLSGAYLFDSDLSGADLGRAYLIGAYLTYADLTGASLAGAELTDADLDGANLTQEQLDSACIKKGGKPPALPEGLKPPQKVCVPRTR